MKHPLLPTLLALPFLLLAGAPAEVAAQDGISVEIVVTTGVEDREPVDATAAFPLEVGRVYAWMRVTGATDQAIQVVWGHDLDVFTVPLEIGGSPWRTWSSKNIPPEWAGEWIVEVQDAEGNVLASSAFTVGG